jgi:hypothetical protein
LSESKTREKLKEMAKLAILANRISDFHEKNLTTYPFVFFNGVQVTRIDYDFSRPTEEDPEVRDPYINYHLQIDETQDNSHLDKRCDALETAVRGLLFSDIVLEVFFNGNSVFKSKKNG